MDDEEKKEETPCMDICILGEDDRCIACGRTLIEMTLVTDAEKL